MQDKIIYLSYYINHTHKIVYITRVDQYDLKKKLFRHIIKIRVILTCVIKTYVKEPTNQKFVLKK